MEPVSEDFVEQYGDFFFRLTNNQLEERKEEFKKKQPNMYNIANGRQGYFKSAQIADITWRFELLMYHCLESEFGTIPIVHPAIVQQYVKDSNKRQKAIGKELSVEDYLQKEAEMIEQPCFLNWMDEKLKYYIDDIKMITLSQASDIYQGFVLEGGIYQSALNKKIKTII